MNAGGDAGIAPPGSSLRVFFAAGPGDVVGTFRHWKVGRDDPSQMSVTFSGQFFDVCRDLGLTTYTVAWHARADRDGDARNTVVHVPKPTWSKKGGWRFHLAELWYALRLVARAAAFRADVVLVTGGLQLLAFQLLRPLRIQLVVDFACVLWRKYQPVSGASRFLHLLDRPILRSQALALLSASCEITAQLTEVARGHPRPVVEYWPLYRRGRLDPMPLPTTPPFRVVFAGRIEAYKGVFDLVELASRFRASGADIVIDLCGEGCALEEVRRRVARGDLGSHLIVHGYCMFDKLRQMYARAHAVIVPTTSEFVEGFNMVVAEAVLAGRPVVTSDVCPAVHYLGEAVVRVRVDDVDAYENALIRMSQDPDFLARTWEAGMRVREKFFEPQNAFASAWRAVLQAAEARQSVIPRSLPLDEPPDAARSTQTAVSPGSDVHVT